MDAIVENNNVDEKVDTILEMKHLSCLTLHNFLVQFNNRALEHLNVVRKVSDEFQQYICSKKQNVIFTKLS